MGWIWLGLARAAARHPDPSFREQKLWTCRYFFAAELPRIQGMVALLTSESELTSTVPEELVSA